MNADNANPTLNDLLDATLASRDAFVAAAKMSPPSHAAALSHRAFEQARLAESIAAEIAAARRTTGPNDRPTLVVEGPRTQLPSVQQLRAGDRRDQGTAVLLAAILESRRAYKLAVSLARNAFLPPLAGHS